MRQDSLIIIRARDDVCYFALFHRALPLKRGRRGAIRRYASLKVIGNVSETSWMPDAPDNSILEIESLTRSGTERKDLGRKSEKRGAKQIIRS